MTIMICDCPLNIKQVPVILNTTSSNTENSGKKSHRRFRIKCQMPMGGLILMQWQNRFEGKWNKLKDMSMIAPMFVN
jgi:hypothetical protein